MKTLFFCLLSNALFIVPAQARLGMTPGECSSLYGTARTTEGDLMLFVHGGFAFVCKFIDGVCMEMEIQKLGPGESTGVKMSNEEIANFLKANARAGERWSPRKTENFDAESWATFTHVAVYEGNALNFLIAQYEADKSSSFLQDRYKKVMEEIAEAQVKDSEAASQIPNLHGKHTGHSIAAQHQGEEALKHAVPFILTVDHPAGSDRFKGVIRQGYSAVGGAVAKEENVWSDIHGAFEIDHGKIIVKFTKTFRDFEAATTRYLGVYTPVSKTIAGSIFDAGGKVLASFEIKVYTP